MINSKRGHINTNNSVPGEKIKGERDGRIQDKPYVPLPAWTKNVVKGNLPEDLSHGSSRGKSKIKKKDKK